MNGVYLTLKGVPSDGPTKKDEVVFLLDPQGAWVSSIDDGSFEVEGICVRMYDALAGAVFGTLEEYHKARCLAPNFAFSTGLNSESSLPKAKFEQVLKIAGSKRDINRLLYLIDCGKLVSNIQECTKEITHLRGEFYRALNLDVLLYSPVTEQDGVRLFTSPVVTKIHAVLGFIFIRLHSLLDYVTKLTYEVDHLQRGGFEAYPRLRSNKILFGNRKHISIGNAPGTVFESCDEIIEIETYRNHIIHDGLLDDIPKVYQVVESSRIVEKYVLLPDRGPNGRLEKYVNRNLFYGGEDKINLRLPSLIKIFNNRVFATLTLVARNLEASSA
ncbi:MAG: hypothetical protein NPIRA03_01180 [Nitrospirales bacterium]|nr:MAG: hypothetical protein NPIRA03_01180 [Nitrospirales bacterium]